MKTILRLIDLYNQCLKSDHRKRGLACIICMSILATTFVIGAFYTVNNFIDKPINVEGKMERSK
jgi:hypothetical protein